MIGSPVLQNFLYDLPLLVDLDGINAEVAALITVFGDGRLKRGVNLAQPVFQNVGEADQDGQRNTAQYQRVDQFLEVDGARRVLFGMNPNVAVRRRPRNSPYPSSPHRRGRWHPVWTSARWAPEPSSPFFRRFFPTFLLNFQCPLKTQIGQEVFGANVFF